jgi:type 1 glutamine amidotransferase
MGKSQLEEEIMKKVLMVTHSAGFKHDYLPVASEVIKKLGEESKKFSVDVDEKCEILRKENLRNYHCLLFATTGELPISEEDKIALISFVKNSKGFVGIHNATDTFYEFPEYGEMLGGYFNGHPWSQKVRVIVEDKNHPATSHLPDVFSVEEEVYVFKNWSREKTRVLIKLDNTSVDISKGNREDRDYALCWCHRYGDGRVFYTGFGHYLKIWEEEWFQKHLLGGILWALNLTDF